MIERVVVQNLGRFANLDVTFPDGLTIVVGANESGKSTLLGAIELALSGRVGSRWFRDILTSDWFHRPTVADYFAALDRGERVAAPEIYVEVHLADDDNQFQKLRGLHNVDGVDAVGLSLSVTPAADYAAEFAEYLEIESRPDALPVEYYDIEWRSFADERMGRRPKGLSHVLIDASTITGRRGVDHHTQQLLDDLISPGEHARVSVADRLARQDATEDVLEAANNRIAAAAPSHGPAVSLGIAPGPAGGWRRAVSPMLDGLPLPMSGQGSVAATKVTLAVMKQDVGSGSHVLVEEPENHLAHTRLTSLIGRLAHLADDRQVIVTTHSSYVSNRLGLDRLVLLNGDVTADVTRLSVGTVRYFRALSGFDTLRLVLADRVVLVEGPSDEIVFSRFYRDTVGREALDDGIDVISLNGLAFDRALELAVAVDVEVIAVRDNDGMTDDEVRAKHGDWLDVRRRLIVGDRDLGHTLEPQIVSANTEDEVRAALAPLPRADVETWMRNNKTEAALRILDCDVQLTPPPYIAEAIRLLTE